MRVTHAVRSDAFAGVERYVADVASEQAARGHQVTVIGGDPERMRSELPCVVTWRPARTTQDVVRALIDGAQRDIVHVHMTAAEIAGVLTRPIHRAAVVATRHFAAPRGSSAAIRLARSPIGRSLAEQISISRFVADAIGEPSSILYNGVRSQPSHSYRRARVVLCLNRLEPEKATDVALRAWAASGIADDGWMLHIAGAGTERPYLEALALDLGVATTVRFLGHIADTAAHLRGAAALLATATAEPFGLSVVEAMAHGTPVLASDGGAHPELIGDQDWTFPSGNASAAAFQLRRFALISEEERQGIGEHLRQRQRQLFDLTRHITALDELYSNVRTKAGLPHQSSS
jgi:glycosyltransferase involved in cell wall biosynthesis